MKLSRRIGLALPWLLLSCPIVPARAAQVVVERVGATSQGFLFVDYRLERPFEGKVLEAIRSGLPSTLTYTIEVWRQRSGWWDKLEETRETQMRVLRDLLNEQYVLATREEVRRFADLDTLTHYACTGRREYLRPLAPDRTYYAVVSANLAPLSVEDLRELEEWLQGTIRGSDGRRAGGISGLSGTMVGLLMSVTGFGDVTVHERTERFVPALLQQTRPEAAPPRAPRQEAGGHRSGERP